MTIVEIVTLFGGLGLFLYGMKTMGDGLEKLAGNKMQRIIEMLTGNIFKGVLVGTLVTALIQSSSATTVMVVGFVNAGVMTLTQAVGIIMGANIGTTITAQIIRLGDISGTAWYLELLKPTFLAPVALIAGVVLIMSMKKKRGITIGEILSGFGMLFIGINIMESAVTGLRDLPAFQDVFVQVGANPLLGVAAGAIITAIIQSSSASIGILQAASATGFVTYASAIPIIMGQNIGTCVTALLSSIGASKNAKRAAIVHLLFNIIGTIIFMIVIYTLQYTFGLPFWEDVVNKGAIADVHTLFNVANTLILLPFSGFLVYISKKVIKGKKEEKTPSVLEDRLLSTPSLALSQASHELVTMARIAEENVGLAYNALINRKFKNIPVINDNEKVLDTMEGAINQYLTKIVDKPLNFKENQISAGLFHIVNDVERIGDHAQNLSEIAAQVEEHKVVFSDAARRELSVMFEAAERIVNLTISAYESNDNMIAEKVEPLEEVIDLMKETLKDRHINRLTAKQCDIDTGILFLDTINNLERIADHSSNIAVAVLQMQSEDESFDPHRYLHDVHVHVTAEYQKNFEHYKEKYSI